MRVMPQALDLGARIVASVRAHDLLVGPGRAMDHDRGAVGAAHRRELAHDRGEVVDRQMDRERRPGRGEGGERLARRHRRGAHRGPGQDHRLRDAGQRQLLAERRGGGGEGRHARGHVVVDAERAQAARLLGDRAVERGVARVHPRDVQALADAARSISAMIASRSSGAVSITRGGTGASSPACGDDLGRHQRAGVEHDRAAPDQAQAAQRDQVRRAGAGADEVHRHGRQRAGRA